MQSRHVKWISIFFLILLCFSSLFIAYALLTIICTNQTHIRKRAFHKSLKARLSKLAGHLYNRDFWNISNLPENELKNQFGNRKSPPSIWRVFLNFFQDSEEKRGLGDFPLRVCVVEIGHFASRLLKLTNSIGDTLHSKEIRDGSYASKVAKKTQQKLREKQRE